MSVLVLAPAAGAWSKLSGDGLANIVDPSVLRTQAGSELVAYDSPTGGTISLIRNGGAPRTLVTGDPIAGEAQLVQQPSGAIQLYFPDAHGVGRLTSTDDGQSWTGPIQTASRDVGGVRSATVRADGTPIFSQDGTGFVNVFAVSLKKIGKIWTATVVDDGFGVPGATVTGGGRTLHTGAGGRVSLAGLRHHTFMRATHAGYVGTGFRVP